MARRVRGPWHADGGTLECVLFNVGGRATGAVGRRARIASDGAGDGDAPFSMARQTFSRRTREIYPRNVCFWRKLGKNQTNCSYATAFSEIVKIPSEGERGNRERDTWDVFVGSAPQVELQLGKLPGCFLFTRNSRIPIGPRRADFEIQCKKTC